MSTITREWLKQTISELEQERDATPGVVNEDAVMALEAMRIALASLEAPAVMYASKETLDAAEQGEHLLRTLSKPSGDAVIPLYAAPPAPVVMDEVLSRELFEKWCSVNIERNKWHPEYYAHYPATGQWGAWEACRAAMLQGADGNSPVVQDGWVMVPVEPTYQMCKAMGLPWESPRFPDRYKAMIATAPKV